ncbi:hypothetical protein ACLB2K_005692 [Fragaria x ananassa]
MALMVEQEDEPLEFHDASTSLDDQTYDSEEPLPLHAITKSSLDEMMRLEGTIHKKPIRVFIDCGSASNFLNPAVATQLGILVHHDSSLRFTSASGYQLRPSGTVREVTVHIQGYNFTDDLLLLPLRDVTWYWERSGSVPLASLGGTLPIM